MAVWYRPTAHTLQALAPAAEYDPAGHEPEHATLRPLTELYLPAAHELHEEVPVEVWYCPLGQAVHDACPVDAWNRPASHAVHALAPAAE